MPSHPHTAKNGDIVVFSAEFQNTDNTGFTLSSPALTAVPATLNELIRIGQDNAYRWGIDQHIYLAIPIATYRAVKAKFDKNGFFKGVESVEATVQVSDFELMLSAANAVAQLKEGNI